MTVYVYIIQIPLFDFPLDEIMNSLRWLCEPLRFQDVPVSDRDFTTFVIRFEFHREHVQPLIRIGFVNDRLPTREEDSRN